MRKLLCFSGLLLACAPAPSVDQSSDMALQLVYTDAGAAQLGIEVYRDATLDLPDVLPLNEDGACRTGQTAGTVCAPNGSVIAGARVVAETRTCRGEAKLVETAADIRGYFVLEGLAPGPVNITITSGSFVGRYAVDIVAGREVTVLEGSSSKVCLPADNARLAVLTGDYDDIAAVIAELGFQHDVFCGGWEYARPAYTMLSDRSFLNEYAILFVNCSSGIDWRANNPEIEQIKENVRDFVRRGGSLYVSDLAVDWVQEIWPEAVEFRTSTPREHDAPQCCICTDCPAECYAESPGEPPPGCGTANDYPDECRQPVGPTGFGRPGEVAAQVTSPFLRQFLETDQFPVNFDAGGWVQIENISPDVEVLVESEERPMMILFEPYPNGGRVAYTSFHNHVQATEAMLQTLRALVFRL